MLIYLRAKAGEFFILTTNFTNYTLGNEMD